MNRIIRTMLMLLLLAAASVCLSDTLRNQCAVRSLIYAREEHEIFRAMQMSEETLSQLEVLHSNTFLTVGQLLPLLYAETRGDFSVLPDQVSETVCLKRKQMLLEDAQQPYEKLAASYSAIWDDLEYFPVAGERIRYENSWMFERNYGGKRGHEGTDLMPPENLAGYYPVLSMTDGTVEKIGWLEQGGYRIGIRSPSGGYFYYAHLDSYAQEFRVGESVYAGQILGRMGDTGYGPEGTRGMFDVHLHLGIYIRTDRTEELSINPYWILRYLEKKDVY